MQARNILTAIAICLSAGFASAQYNTLYIPDTLSGTNFDLTAKDTFKQMITGNQTVTAGINGNWWGPTLIFKKGDVVHMTVHNQLQDTTTIHWHGMHLPAIMDGGPHQTIPPFTTWSPYWQVTNNAGLYWYHPHLDMQALHQITSGLGGLIIVRDSIEGSLQLPRTYSVDDIPLVLTDRRFDGSNQLVDAPYGDSMMVNGTLRAQYNIPAQVVRLRILNAATERSYNIGFSDNRTFYIITTDGGLVNTPVPVTRLLLSVGERIEILVNCSGQLGTSFDLRAYNANMPNGTPGDEPINFAAPFGNALGAIDFNILHFNVTAQTSSPITAIPTALNTNSFYSASSSQLTRTVTISDSLITPPAPTFMINRRFFNMNYIDYTVPLDHTEIWQIVSTSTFSHPFHIHDVQFYILTRNGVAPPASQQGWKDVTLIRGGETVTFIAKFSDFSDSLHPYMFHCHIAGHEDLGMMGQFVVGNSPAGIKNVANNKMKIFPNPGTGKLYFEMADNISIAEALVINTSGQTVLFSNPNSGKGIIDVSSLSNGIYFVKLFDTDGQSYIKTYLKE